MKYLQLAVVLGLIPASPVLADSPQRENALNNSTSAILTV